MGTFQLKKNKTLRNNKLNSLIFKTIHTKKIRLFYPLSGKFATEKARIQVI